MSEIPQELQEQIQLEDALLDLLSSIWTMYDKLPILHPLDKATFQAAIHKAQAIVLARPKMRGIFMARQGMPSQEAIAPPQYSQQPQPNQQFSQQPGPQPNQPMVPTQPVPMQSIAPNQSLGNQPTKIPLRPGERAAAVAPFGTGGTKTLGM